MQTIPIAHTPCAFGSDKFFVELIGPIAVLRPVGKRNVLFFGPISDLEQDYPAVYADIINSDCIVWREQ